MARSTRPIGLTRRDIVQAALAIVRERGMAALTMRALSSELGVTAPTLYHHVGDKAALLDLISAEAFRSIERPAGAYDDVATLEDWAGVLRDDVLRLRAIYLEHPGLARAVVDHARMADAGPPEPAHTPPELDALVRLGVPRRQAQETIEAMARWTMAMLATEAAVPDATFRDRLFHDGLDVLLAGACACLRDVDPV